MDASRGVNNRPISRNTKELEEQLDRVTAYRRDAYSNIDYNSALKAVELLEDDIGDDRHGVDKDREGNMLHQSGLRSVSRARFYV